ncbi:MAG: class I SAM-dependent methyltransferase [Longimicrobiaceae bacterium]
MSAAAAPPSTSADGPAAPLPPRTAYRLWAPSYEQETAISFVDDRLVAALTPPLHGLRLLDAGCGTGRRLRAAEGATLAAGADLTWEMLAAGASTADAPSPLLATADVRALPFASAGFDVVWCRLVVGHLSDPASAYTELGRVCAPGGTVVVTDFHPDAARAGHTRSFRDAAGTLHDVEHHVHSVDDHLAAARAAGLTPAERRDGVIDGALRPFYARAGRLDRFAQDEGLAVVLALSFRRGE